jgi:hypothetical protein
MSEEKTFSIESIAKGILDSIGDALEDITKLTVVTTTGKIITATNSKGKSYLEIEETAINAKTIIEIDGDIITRIPVQNQEGETITVDERMLQLHEKNVEMAMQNWQTVITTLINTVKALKPNI